MRTIDAIILCGGLGTRFRTVAPDIPKALAPLGTATCLDVIADNLFSQGVRKIILATGYRGKQIKTYVQKTALYSKGTIIFSEERTPLGTGGALKKALRHVKSAHFLLVNGDTVFQFHLRSFADFHKKKNAALSIALSRRTTEDSGGLMLSPEGEIIAFRERASLRQAPFASGGVYLMNKKSISAALPSQKIFSLEYDFLPFFIKHNSSFGFCTNEKYIDIGTPKRYINAKKKWSR